MIFNEKAKLFFALYRIVSYNKVRNFNIIKMKDKIRNAVTETINEQGGIKKENLYTQNQLFFKEKELDNRYTSYRIGVMLAILLGIFLRPVTLDLSVAFLFIGVVGLIIEICLRLNLIKLHSFFQNFDVMHGIKKTLYFFIEMLHRIWILLFVVGFIRVLIIDFYHIPTQSMLPNYPVSTKVFVSKPLLMNNDFNNGDVVVFKHKEFGTYIKRIIAKENDKIIITPTTISVKNQNGTEVIQSNFNELENKQFTNYEYNVEQRLNQLLPTEVSEKLTAKQFVEKNNNIQYGIIVEPKSLSVIEKELLGQDINFSRFPHKNFFGWKYCYDFQEYSNRIECTLPKDFYFMMGDNRTGSYDSRYWGFVKKEDIYGKVIYSF